MKMVFVAYWTLFMLFYFAIVQNEAVQAMKAQAEIIQDL